MTTFTPRPHQEEILTYSQGTMGISAVPGSGKTWTLSALAARLIADGFLGEEQEILIVTLTNSAVDNFTSRISEFLSQESLRPLIPPYRVRTLHGLAHDIVRERPDLVGLDSSFIIVDERESDRILNAVANAWLSDHPHSLDEYLRADLEPHRIDHLRRKDLPYLVQSIAKSFIRTAKDQQVTPSRLWAQLDKLPIPLPLAEMGAEMYTQYQRSLDYRGGVDFDDLIRLALQALQSDPDLLERLRERWPYILEDEAQDSSRLQEEILRLLAGPQGNWVRVGDPNQAIYESFTTANPRFLRRFMQHCDFPRQLPGSGRSTLSIIKLANYLIQWTMNEHPLPEARQALTTPFIEPVPEGDLQSNPPDRPDSIFLIPTRFTPQGELRAVADSIARWLPDHPDDTLAVLVPRNQRGFDMIDELRRRSIPVVDSLLRITSTTRFAAGALSHLLRYLCDPLNARKLARAYEVWRRKEREDSLAWAQVQQSAQILKRCPRVEDFIWPKRGQDWLQSQMDSLPAQSRDSLLAFREVIRRWQGTVLLPVNQIVLTLAQDLFEEPADLAVAHKLAALLRQAENAHPDWRLPELAEELSVIARNERRFTGFTEDSAGFDPDNYKGQVVVATVHKAKGLEWDRVYLMAVNNYNFPSGDPQDSYYPEKWFVRQNLNLEAETLAQFQAAFSNDPHNWYEEGKATQEARYEFIRERLRLLYVGVTRARKELVITWNTGRGTPPQQPALPLLALQEGWETIRSQE